METVSLLLYFTSHDCITHYNKIKGNREMCVHVQKLLSILKCDTWASNYTYGHYESFNSFRH